MVQKVIDVPGIGEVVLAKRRGSRGLRLTIQPDGRVRVGLPYWAPYSAAIKFALTRSDWISQNRKQYQRSLLRTGDLIGKSYRLQFISRPPGKRPVATRISPGLVSVSSHLRPGDPKVQSAAAKASERALKKETEVLLAPRLAELARRHRFTYRSLRIKRLTSRWGSCSADDVITLNYFLVQLPWPLIDYVLLHELLHTKHRNHSAVFWRAFELILPSARQLRKTIHQYRPVLQPKSALHTGVIRDIIDNNEPTLDSRLL